MSTRVIVIPKNKINIAGKILGIRGENIRRIQKETKARIFIDNSTQNVIITGKDISAAINRIESIIKDSIWQEKWNSLEFKDEWEKYYVWWYFYNRLS
jgi:phosphate starvation-inducible protein PhoH